MHQAAKQWDIDHGFIPSEWPKEGTKDRPIPESRPCDKCGKMVEKGYIHKKCLEEERNFWLDILY